MQRNAELGSLGDYVLFVADQQRSFGEPLLEV
jgi:hypothetical protein